VRYHDRVRATHSFAVGALVALGACVHDWDDYDPHAGDAAAASSTGGSGGMLSTSSSGAQGGSPSTSSSGAQGGSPATSGAGGSAVWFDAGLDRRRPISIAAVTEPLADFPLLVRLDATRIDYALTQPGGADLRFVADDHATLLAHEIEVWDDQGESFVWVRIPELGATPTTVWMYHGGSPASAPPDPHAAWSNGFVAVWHLGAGLSDASGNGHDGNPSGELAEVTGFTGSARDFDGAEDFIDVSASAALDSLFVGGGGTITAWIRPDSAGEVQRGRILDRSTDAFFTGGWSFLMGEFHTPGSVSFAYGFAPDFGWWTTPASSIVYAEWQHVAVSFSESMASPLLYVDGLPQTPVVGEIPMGMPAQLDGLTVRIGNRTGGIDRDFAGLIDELRVATGIRAAGWISAEVQAARDELLEVGDEEQR
jgi:hypothetical protein